MKFSTVTLMIILLFVVTLSEGAGKKVSEIGNKHNFSFKNTSANFRASNSGDSPTYPRSSQVCVFCHTPHNSIVQGPLWNRKSIIKTFKHFSSDTLVIDNPTVKSTSEYGQPTGSSRLCLSCHDGVTALGALFATPGSIASADIPFTDVKKGTTSVNTTLTHETYSSHHPVSFKYNNSIRAIINLTKGTSEYRYTQTTNEVKLDSQERMQCTTCHNPHQDQSTTPDPANPFWVSKTYTEVCVTCHGI